MCAHFCYKMLQNVALWDICWMHCGICEMGLLGSTMWCTKCSHLARLTLASPSAPMLFPPQLSDIHFHQTVFPTPTLTTLKSFSHGCCHVQPFVIRHFFMTMSWHGNALDTDGPLWGKSTYGLQRGIYAIPFLRNQAKVKHIYTFSKINSTQTRVNFIFQGALLLICINFYPRMDKSSYAHWSFTT